MLDKHNKRSSRNACTGTRMHGVAWTRATRGVDCSMRTSRSMAGKHFALRCWNALHSLSLMLARMHSLRFTGRLNRMASTSSAVRMTNPCSGLPCERAGLRRWKHQSHGSASQTASRLLVSGAPHWPTSDALLTHVERQAINAVDDAADLAVVARMAEATEAAAVSSEMETGHFV